MMHVFHEKDTILPDDYPVYAGYIYIIDNTIVRSDVFGTVGALKNALGAKTIRRCEMLAHRGAKIGDKIYSSYLNL